MIFVGALLSSPDRWWITEAFSKACAQYGYQEKAAAVDMGFAEHSQLSRMKTRGPFDLERAVRLPDEVWSAFWTEIQQQRAARVKEMAS